MRGSWALSMLLDGIKGFDIENEPHWWKRPIGDFSDQRKWACDKCGAAIPLKPRRSNLEIDDISLDNYELLKEQSGKIKREKYKIFTGDIDTKQERNACWYRYYGQNAVVKVKP